MYQPVVLRVGSNTFTTRRAVLNSHPCSLLGRAFDSDSSSAALHQNERGEYELSAADLGDAVASGPAALFASLLGSYTTDVLIPVPGCTREQLLDAAERLGIDWARTAHDLVASDSRADIARGVRMFSVHVLSTHAHDADALLWAALGLHRLGRHRDAAVLLARLLDDDPDNLAARTLALVVADARAHSRHVGFVDLPIFFVVVLSLVIGHGVCVPPFEGRRWLRRSRQRVRSQDWRSRSGPSGCARTSCRPCRTRSHGPSAARSRQHARSAASSRRSSTGPRPRHPCRARCAARRAPGGSGAHAEQASLPGFCAFPSPSLSTRRTLLCSVFLPHFSLSVYLALCVFLLLWLWLWLCVRACVCVCADGNRGRVLRRR